jgi:hypothetical protein
MPAPYCWVITKDTLAASSPATIKSSEGLCGPRSCHLSRAEIEAHPNAKKFRLLDDDREVYVEGVMVDLSGHTSGFEPQDDYGEGALGTTIIQYWQPGAGGGWKDL